MFTLSIEEEPAGNGRGLYSEPAGNGCGLYLEPAGNMYGLRSIFRRVALNFKISNLRFQIPASSVDFSRA
ncbi:MAG: hypothetical protein JWN92_1436 [Candidatus Acidoferrum typicum]|nr:hypothetical protein [Candidatus Acidoferrum typicum]